MRPPDQKTKSLQIVLALAIYILCINVKSFTLMVQLLSLYLVLLFLYGLHDFQGFLVIVIALVPVRSYLLIFGSFLGFEVTFNRLIILIALALFVFKKPLLAKMKDKSSRFFSLFILLIAMDLLSDIMGDGAFSPGFKRTVSVMIEVYFFSFIYLYSFMKEDLKRLVKGFSIGCMALCVMCIIEAIWGVNFLFQFPVSSSFYEVFQSAEFGRLIARSGFTRIRGSFQNPVYLSGFLPLLYFTAFYFIVKEKRPYPGFVILLFSIAVSVFSLSRTALYGIIIFFVCALINLTLFKQYKMIINISIMILAVGLIASVLFPGYIHEARDLILNPTDEKYGAGNVETRIELFGTGIPFILKQNIFGIGYDEAAIQKSREIAVEWPSVFLGTALSKGSVYTIVFVGILTIMFNYLWTRRDITNSLLLCLFISLMATYLSYGEYWISLPMFLIFFFAHNNNDKYWVGRKIKWGFSN